MAGYLNAHCLENIAIGGAKWILVQKDMLGTFDENPDGCFRYVALKLLFNNHFVQPLVDNHPSFAPVVEKARQAIIDGQKEAFEICSDLFEDSIELYLTETYQYDIDFNIMMAATLCNFFSEEIREQYKAPFFRVIEQITDDVTGLCSIILLSCALWGANYENFRILVTNKYYELKAQGFGSNTEEANSGGQAAQGPDESQQARLLETARKNVDHYDEKVQFVLDVKKKLDNGDMDALGEGPVSELGKQYARYYMEIERYGVAPSERVSFIFVCLCLQPDLVTWPNGIVSGDFFIDQFEKLIEEDRKLASNIATDRETASRISDLAHVERMEDWAAGGLNRSKRNWQKIQDYYFPKAVELGWDRYYADGIVRWEPDSSSESSQIYSTNTDNRSAATSGGCYIATAVYGSYDCPQVWTLRRFRDFSLAQSWYGRLFIKLYYAVSPTLVKCFGDMTWFQAFWRNKLDKVVDDLQKRGYGDNPYQDQG